MKYCFLSYELFTWYNFLFLFNLIDWKHNYRESKNQRANTSPFVNGENLVLSITPHISQDYENILKLSNRVIEWIKR